MIKAEDLRIGNWVEIDGIKTQILSIGLTSLQYQSFNNGVGEDWFERIINDFKPILLNEEILLKCGFQKSLIYNNTYHLTINTLNGSHDIFIDISANVLIIGMIEIADFKHLHQLQNLTHSLVQELNIEL